MINIKNILKILFLLPFILALAFIEDSVANAATFEIPKDDNISSSYTPPEIDISDIKSKYKNYFIVDEIFFYRDDKGELNEEYSVTRKVHYTNSDSFLFEKFNLGTDQRYNFGYISSGFLMRTATYRDGSYIQEDLKKSDGGQTYISSRVQDEPYGSDIAFKFVESTAPFVDSKGDELLPPFEDTTPSVDEDIPNFGWEGDGVRLTFPLEGQTIKGYTSIQGGALMDFQILGKFHYKPGFFQLDKAIQTSIVNSLVVRLGDTTKVAGQLGGVGLKQFQWVTRPGDDEDGLITFKLTGYIPIWQKGDNLDFTVGVSLPNNSDGYTYYSDSTTVSTKQTNSEAFEDGYVPPTEGEDSGQINGGNSWNPRPDKPSEDNKSPLDWIKYYIGSFTAFLGDLFSSILDLFESFANMLSEIVKLTSEIGSNFSKLFSFLPSPLPSLINFCFATICVVAVFRFLRG